MLEDKFTLLYFDNFVPFSIISVLDILVVAFVFYKFLGLIRGTRAAPILVGLFVVVSVAVAAPRLKMEALAYKTEPTQIIDEVVAGVEQLASMGYGALIVLGREVGLGSVVATGVQINARVSADLLTTIFTPRSSLHDQAVIIQGETLVAARCTLPLAEDIEDRRLGTRHRAALGLSQESDAVTVVVSEENRAISLAIGGVLVRGVGSRDLKQRLAEHLTPGEGKIQVMRGDDEV